MTENKKTIILTVIGVVALLISILGATYAYFMVGVSNNFNTPKIEASTESIGSVTLQTGSNLYLNLTRINMSEENQGDYYATTSEDGNASTTIQSAVIGKTNVEGNGTYSCNYTLKVTNPDNYICFGTSDKDTCTGDTDKYMYRIIGIFEDEAGNKHAKLIKKEALNTLYAWHSDSTTDVDWNNSDLYKGLNGSYFLTNTDYSYMQDTSWTNKISTWNYTMTNTKSYENYINNYVFGPNYYYETGKTIYLHELNRSRKSNETCHYTSNTADCNAGEWKNLSTKVSLMYASDYALSLGETSLNYIGTNDKDLMKTGWMYISNNDSGAPNGFEWTMSRYGKGAKEFYGLYVESEGYILYAGLNYTFVARPVFYLASDVEFSTNSGDGSITNPYIIS